MTDGAQSAAALVAQLAEAGTPPQLLAAVAQALFKAETETAALEARRANDRARQARRHVNSREVTGDDVKPCDPSLEVFPPPPFPNSNQDIPPLSPPKKSKGRRSKFEFQPPEWMPPEPWQAFVDHRQAMRNIPFTAAAAQGVVDKIEGLRADGHCPAKLLSKAVMHGWRTVFDAEDTKGYSARDGPIDMDEYRDRLERIGQSDATH